MYEEFAAKFAAKVGQLQVGAGTEAGVAQGPLINAAGLSKVESHVADARRPGRPRAVRRSSPSNAAATSSSRPCWPT